MGRSSSATRNRPALIDLSFRDGGETSRLRGQYVATHEPENQRGIGLGIYQRLQMGKETSFDTGCGGSGIEDITTANKNWCNKA